MPIRATDRPPPRADALRTRAAGGRRAKRPPDVWIRVDGEVDLDSVPRLRDAFDKALAERPERLHLDMAAVEFCDSSGLNTLIFARQRLEEWDGRMLLTPSRRVRRLLDLTGAAELFTLDAVPGDLP
ncbi:STAS domain-containing protein [Yinghuangia aomiensis]